MGGVYQVISITETGSLNFRQCERGHDPTFFNVVPKASQPKFKQFDAVRLKPNHLVLGHKCALLKDHTYQVGSVDDFNRVFFHHQGCNNWHDPDDLVDETPNTFGKLIRSIREREKMSIGQFAEKLDEGKPEILSQVFHRHYMIKLLIAVEAGTDAPHVATAARWARKLGYPQELFVKLAIQQQMDSSDLKHRVEISG